MSTDAGQQDPPSTAARAPGRFLASPAAPDWAPLRSYGAIGDGRTVGLVARDGRIDWLPLPDLNSPPAFAAILDRDNGGYLELQPLDADGMTVHREYVDGTNVLCTTWTGPNGQVRVTDSLNSGIAGRLPWSELARRIEGLQGAVPMRWRVAPGTALGTATPWRQDTVHGQVLRLDGITMAVRLLGEMDVEVGEQDVAGEFTATAGERWLVGLVATDSEPLHLNPAVEVDAGIERTIDSWQRWSRTFTLGGRGGRAGGHADGDPALAGGPGAAGDGDRRERPGGEFADAVLRSALALKLLIHSPHGSIAAAATTSLPESWDGGKNWDYRYAWVRDMAYTLNALFRYGVREDTHAAVSWLLRTIREDGPELSVFYEMDGTRPEGHHYPELPGWREIGPVVVGNAASTQLQLGVFGDLFDIVRLAVLNEHLIDADTGRILAAIADRTCDLWIRPDAGMWELHDERHYTSSKLGCWQALQCAADLADRGQIPGDPSRWRSEADRIAAWVRTHCWDDDRGAYVWYPGTRELDASVLLHAISGFDTGPRMSSTIDAVRAELGDGPLLYRYSGMEHQEGSFVACAFWTVAALAAVGRVDEGRDLMRQLVPMGNDVGLFAEMIDPRDGAFLGNLPQALSHLALLQAAMALEEPPGDEPGHS